ncbi:MAG: hypothetical protein LBM66_07555 [Bifidobacteriaceae bacterium]|nr:hypothetical protein [Bifidobacteriaceae bacterium]
MLISAALAGSVGGVVLAGAPEASADLVYGDPSLPTVTPDPSATTYGPVVVQPSKDVRSVETSLYLDAQTGELFGWGDLKYGMDGYVTAKSNHGQFNDPPRLLGQDVDTGINYLPQGAIVDSRSGIYNFNAVDTEGCVWGWGWYPDRDGTQKVESGYDYSTRPRRLRIGGNALNTSKPQLCGITQVSGGEQSGAGLSRDGHIYAWGYYLTGGPADPGETDTGASLVQGLPEPDHQKGTWPVSIKGGFNTVWVMLENGEVYYFGGDYYNYERPSGDEPACYSGTVRGPDPKRACGDYPRGTGSRKWPVMAVESSGLAPWFRENNPSEYIVSVVSGIHFGAAVLSDGKVLSWGQEPGGALGRTCGGSSPDACTAVDPRCQHGRPKGEPLCQMENYPDYVETLPDPAQDPVVNVQATFTSAVVLTRSGKLFGYGGLKLAGNADWTGLSRWVTGKLLGPWDGKLHFGTHEGVAFIAEGVVGFNVGQGYVIYETADGRWFGQGTRVGGNLGNVGIYPLSSYGELDDDHMWVQREVLFLPAECGGLHTTTCKIGKKTVSIKDALAQGLERTWTFPQWMCRAYRNQTNPAALAAIGQQEWCQGQAGG